MMIKITQDDIKRVFITGTSGSGKSVLLKKLAFNLVWAKEPRTVVLIDPCEEHSDISDRVILVQTDKFGKIRKLLEWYFNRAKKGKLSGPTWIMIDELQEFCPNKTNIETSDVIKKIVRQGRKHNLHFIGASQKPRDVDTTLRTLFTSMFIFRLKGLDLLMVMRDSGLDRIWRYIIPNLKRGDCIFNGLMHTQLMKVRWTDKSERLEGWIIL